MVAFCTFSPGAAVALPEIAVEQPAGTDLTDNSAIINFGQAGLEGRSRTFTIRNAGDADLTDINAVFLAGGNALDFARTVAPATTLAPGETTTFTINFVPGNTGLRTAYLAVGSSDADESPFEMELRGVGVAADTPIIIAQPASQLVLLGQPVSFTAGVASALAITRTWKKGTVKIAASNVPTYTLPVVKATDVGIYSAEAKNTLGTATTNPALFGVVTPGLAAVHLDLKTATSLSLTCTAVAPVGTILTYAWTKAGEALTNGGRISGATGKLLKINAITAADAGVYTCIVTMPTPTGNVQLSNGNTTLTLTPKALALFARAYTESDPNGTEASTGAVSYTGYVDDTIHYTIHYENNTATALTGINVDCTLPANGSLDFARSDSGMYLANVGASKRVRWSVDIPANSSGSKHFVMRILSGKPASTVFLAAYLLQGTKSLATCGTPVVKILAADFTARPSSFGQAWTFAYRPLKSPPTGAIIWAQGSFDGEEWFVLNTNAMTRTSPLALEWTASTALIPEGAHYFRALVIAAPLTNAHSSTFSNFLPETTWKKIATKKSPPTTGDTWTFSANHAGVAADLTVRFQSTLTPDNEGSWTDLPVYLPTARAANVWTSSTYNIPAGAMFFRAIAAAPGWVDSISDPYGPIPVGQTSPVLPPFTYYHIDFKDPATFGQSATFMATCPAVPGLKVRFQSRLVGEDENAWTDLTDGSTTLVGTKWSFKTNYMPTGNRQWRAISSAPGYLDNTQRQVGLYFYDAVYDFEVLPAPIPQMQTIFNAFVNPAHGSVQRTGVNFPVSIELFDFNGVQRVYLETARPGALFKEAPGTNMTNTGGITYATNVTFTGTGPLMLRVAVVDGFNPSQICRSDEVTITVGAGTGGTIGPAIATFFNTFTQATLKSRGAVLIKVRISDDAQVRRAYLHRINQLGEYQSTVGEMTRVSAANPSDFTFLDNDLSDGLYYYRVVAHDFDGNETIKNNPNGYVVSTPSPPPPVPIHLDIAETSRFVMPTLPATNSNYKYIPVGKSGMVTFSYSGLPVGTKWLKGYRIETETLSGPPRPGSDKPFWEQSVTNTSGTLIIKAPFWGVTPSDHEGEGDYRIVAYLGGVELEHGTGVDTFTVGHGWNLPNTFKQVDFGLFWFKDVNNGLRGRGSWQNDEYFDPDKPTVIYVHGWQPGEVQVKRRESWLRQAFDRESDTKNMCAIWKDQGYNVGIFNWNQFGDGDLIHSQANIYYVATEDGLPPGHSMIFSALDSNGKSRKLYRVAGKGGEIEGMDVCDLLYEELRRCLAGYDPGPNKEFRMIGHSLGTQVVGRTCDFLIDNPDGIPLPTRISLLELAQINVNNMDVPAMQRGFITRLKGEQVAIDCYQSTDLQSILGGVNLAYVGEIHDMCAYGRWRPDYIKPLSVGLSVFQNSHNEIVRWYMQSFKYNEFPAYTYWSPFVKRDAVGKAVSASTSHSRVRTLMSGNYWYEQSEGKGTVDITDDQYERK